MHLTLSFDIFVLKQGGLDMEKHLVQEIIADIIVEELSVTKEQVTPEANLVTDLGADDLDLVEMWITVEEKFGIEIPDYDNDVLEKLETVGKVVDYISNLPLK